MGLESATYIQDLVTTNPASGDNTNQGDDHLRLIKAVLDSTFPNADKAQYFPRTAAVATSGPVSPTFPDHQGKLFPVDATSGAITVALPNAASGSTVNEDGWAVMVVKIDSSVNAVVIDPSSSQTVNGASTVSLTTQWAAALCVWDKTDATWYALLFNATSLTPLFTTVDVGAPDTTVARASAGVLSVEGNHVPSPASQAQGDLLYHNGTTWARLGAGTNGQYLKTQGVAANPAWDTLPTVPSAAAQSDQEAASSITTYVSPGRQHFHPGHPKAGGNFHGDGTPAFVSGDYGMGAITDNGTGNFTLAFDTAFNNTNYWLTNWARGVDASGNSCIVSAQSGLAKSASAINIETRNINGGAIDTPEAGVTFWGDYA